MTTDEAHTAQESAAMRGDGELLRPNSMRMSERISNPGKPRVVRGGAPILELFPQVRHDGCV